MSHKVIPANSESTKIKYKIPEYAKDFRKEWLYIRGINKKCGKFISKMKFRGTDIFNYPLSNNIKRYIKSFLKDQERDRLKDISCFYFKYIDVSNIECLEKKLYQYYHISIVANNSEDEEKFFYYYFENEKNFLYFDYVNYFLYLEFPGFHKLLELIILINDKLKIKKKE